MSKVYVVRLRGATKTISFWTKSAFDSFIDLVGDASAVTASVEEA